MATARPIRRRGNPRNWPALLYHVTLTGVRLADGGADDASSHYPLLIIYETSTRCTARIGPRRNLQRPRSFMGVGCPRGHNGELFNSLSSSYGTGNAPWDRSVEASNRFAGRLCPKICNKKKRKQKRLRGRNSAPRRQIEIWRTVRIPCGKERVVDGRRKVLPGTKVAR